MGLQITAPGEWRRQHGADQPKVESRVKDLIYDINVWLSQNNPADKTLYEKTVMVPIGFWPTNEEMQELAQHILRDAGWCGLAAGIDLDGDVYLSLWIESKDSMRGLYDTEISEI
jgi:hypothetical protein